MHRGLRAEIDLRSALHNLEAVRKAVNGLPVIAVVKADAYGHGAVELSLLYEKAGVLALAVAFVSEAEELRGHGIKAPIIVLFDGTEPEKFLDLGLTPVIHDPRMAEAFSREAGKRNVSLGVHLKIDTGMGRMGLESVEDALIAAGLPNLSIEGLMSHFSEADLADMEFMKIQMDRLSQARERLRAKGVSPMCHVSNSAAALSFPEAHLDAVRPGLVLYGCSPFEDDRQGLPELRPVMSAKCGILSFRRLGKGSPVSYGRTFVTKRDTLAAVLAVGYADGYPRSLSNRASVLIKGMTAPVIGRVCMDLTVVDVTDIPDVEGADEAVLLGSDGGESIDVRELARHASTIPYEVLLWLGRGSERVYIGKDD